MIEENPSYTTDLFNSIQEITEGGAGIVYKVTDKTDIYILKIYRSTKLPEAIYQEFSIMSNISSGSFPRYYKLFKKLIHKDLKFKHIKNEDPNEPHIAILCEYIEGKMILDILGKSLCKQDLRILLKAIAAVVCELHLLNIVHRDIKAENVMLSKQKGVVLIDFDTACNDISGIPENRVGTIDYLSYELVKRVKFNDLDDLTFEEWKKSDVWSLGVLFYEIAHGYLPFGKSSEEDSVIWRNILKAPINITQPADDPLIRNIIKHMLERNSTNRISSLEVFRALPAN